MRIHAARRDLAAGVLLVAIGIGVAAAGAQHPLGTLTQMDAGYFPVILGVILAVLGVLVAGASLLPGGEAQIEEDVHTPSLRGCAAIVFSIVIFLVLGRHAGLAPATFFSVLVAAAGDKDATVTGCLALATALTVVAVVVFAWLLQVPFPVIRGF